MRGHYGDFLQSIQFLFMNKKTCEIYQTTYFGRINGGTYPFEWAINPNNNERISYIYVGHGDLIDCISFDGSPIFGGNGGSNHTMISLKSMEVIGVAIRHNWWHIEGIKFILSESK